MLAVLTGVASLPADCGNLMIGLVLCDMRFSKLVSFSMGETSWVLLAMNEGFYLELPQAVLTFEFLSYE